jgi:outer membrane receptor protein involved in Fe transport
MLMDRTATGGEVPEHRTTSSPSLPFKRSLAHTLSLLSSFSAHAAFAAPAAPAQFAIEEIVVTAQKREQLLQDVPVPVSVLNSAALLRAGVQNLNDVARQVPMLEVQTSTSALSTSIRLRRVGNIGNIPTFEPAVGLFVDGAFRTRSVFASSDLFDLERIEVLRGPQSTLYGKNTTGGVVGIYTQAPPEVFTTRGEVTTGVVEGARNASHLQFRGHIGGPLTEGLRGALSFGSTRSGATFDEALVNSGAPSNDTDRSGMRGSLAWGTRETVEWRLTGNLVREDDRRETPDLYFDPAGPLATAMLPTLRTVGVSTACTDNDPHNRVTCIAAPATTDLSMRDITLLGTHEFANGVALHSVSSWDQMVFHGMMADVAQLAAPLLQFHDMQYGESWQQELRLASAPAADFEWQTGVFLYENEHRRGDGGKRPAFVGDRFSAHPAVSAANQRIFDFSTPLPIASPGQAGYLDSWQNTDYFGAYGQATWNATAQFGVTAGARWQTESKDAGIRQWTSDATPSMLSQVLSPMGVSATDLTRDTSKLTWSLTPQWRPRDDLMLFATAATGFKSGGFNTGFGRLPVAQREFGDEDVMHYEVGVKFATSSRWRLAANVFSTRYDDYQEAAFIGSQFTVGNAQEMELDGFELEGMVLLGEHVTADISVSRAEFVYGTHLSGPCYAGRVPDSPLNNGSCVLSGKHPVNAPEWKTHAGLQYDTPYEWGALSLRVDWSWTDAYNTNANNDPRLKQEAYHWLNLRAGARRGDYELILWAENLTDEAVVNYDAVMTIYAVDGSYQSILQAPRSFGVTLRINY